MLDLRSRKTFENVAAQDRCIYCLARGEKIHRSKEHIIPSSLGGVWTLQSASCASCSEITKRFENEVAHKMWGPARSILGLPSKHGTVPTHYQNVLDKDKRKIDPIEIADIPAIAPSWKLPGKPRIVSHPETDTLPLNAQIHLTQFGSFKPSTHGGKTISLAQGKFVDAYFRMICKIAHSYAVGNDGLGSFRPVLTETIINGEFSRLPLWVGEIGEAPPGRKESHFHFLSMIDCAARGKLWTAVLVQLFAQHGMPAHVVIVGESRGFRRADVSKTAYSKNQWCVSL